ncbi:hypothetical protein SAMN04488523_10561 [Sulfitobacter brevis]|uniref:Response regulatory domain-containing protein n=1 Tax=Sulfitobacter brevis TaxID=74348 RepID=A0A1I1XX45_9RHOB|nr:hypothetical protein [Sulfitobacter brevis]SFE11956.1 hypothetical protein SAMN04488523_10561 [Sulfitobacter brevis]
MSFFIYEPDLIVQEDISETLSELFSDCSIRLFDSVDELFETLAAYTEPAVAIVARPTVCLFARLMDPTKLAQNVRFVVIGGGSKVSQPLPGWMQMVPLPFDTTMLISAIRTAISDLR